jgi:hypothetical protein
MQQDCDLGIDFFAAAPIGAINPQEVRMMPVTLHLVRVVQPAVM